MRRPREGRDRRSLRERVELPTYGIFKAVKQRLYHGLPRTCVFVAGMHRSGTNMLMEVLDWNGLTDVYHEADLRAFTPGYEMRDTA